MSTARWDYVGNDRIVATLFVDWFDTGSEDEAVYVFRARDVRNGSYEVVFDGYDETFRRQYYQLPSAADMLSTILEWQRG